MTDLLEDLDEQELGELISSVKSIRSEDYAVKCAPILDYSSMSDSDVLAELLRGDVNTNLIAMRCRVKKVLSALAADDLQAFGHIPSSLRDRDLCLTALGGSPWALQFVPDSVKDREMCVKAVEWDGLVLRDVPPHLIDMDLCMKAIFSDGYALYHVPKSMRDRQTCLAAVKRRGCALDYVPDDLRNHEMCAVAVGNDARAMTYVPEPIMALILGQVAS